MVNYVCAKTVPDSTKLCPMAFPCMISYINYYVMLHSDCSLHITLQCLHHGGMCETSLSKAIILRLQPECYDGQVGHHYHLVYITTKVCIFVGVVYNIKSTIQSQNYIT